MQRTYTNLRFLSWVMCPWCTGSHSHAKETNTFASSVPSYSAQTFASSVHRLCVGLSSLCLLFLLVRIVHCAVQFCGILSHTGNKNSKVTLRGHFTWSLYTLLGQLSSGLAFANVYLRSHKKNTPIATFAQHVVVKKTGKLVLYSHLPWERDLTSVCVLYHHLKWE